MPERLEANNVSQGTEWKSRVVWSVLAVSGTALIVTSALLHPDPSGMGTHQQLGLPPCGFLALTGYPCPGCGLTTSFAHLAHFELFASIHANPIGLLLFLATLAGIPFAVAGAVRGWPVMDTLSNLRPELWVLTLGVGSVLAWIVRIAVRFAGAP